MSRRSSVALRQASLVVLVLCSSLLFGQDNSQNSQANQSRTVRPPLLVNVTGCLKKGSEPGRYYLTDENGRTWELSSKKVDLATHVFHVVSLFGHPTPGPKPQEGKSEEGQKAESGGNLSFGLDVTELTMLSPSCTR
jgi:hypothetical protein